jgi:hypothetical protein
MVVVFLVGVLGDDVVEVLVIEVGDEVGDAFH